MLTIVFDLDGTLIDTAPDLIDALNFTLPGTPCRPSLTRRPGP
jgi:FMN phosphatase YigB (HAD superfamily)